MAHVTVVGLQWGDEGKGKIVDLLSAQAQAVVRFQGGHNAGHTLVVNGVTYKLSLLPSGIVQGKMGIIGNGVVIDPQALQKEIATVKEHGLHVSPQTLKVSDRATLILSIHRELDVMREHAAGAQRIGTTGRGIGPAYEDKVGRRALRVCDLYDLNSLDQRIERLLMHHNTLRVGLGMEHINVNSLKQELASAADTLLPYAVPVHRVIRDLTQQRQRVLFEGAQGALLDVEYGTYPYVTSSSTIAAQAALGSGSSPHHVGYIMGVIKAYATRVGEGPFLTELHNDAGQRIATRGREVGTVTGRARRCGAFDAVAARETALLCGAHGLALTKLDVLDEETEIQICTGYKLPDGTITDVLPASTAVLQHITPVYEVMEGWRSNTQGIDSYANLPAAAIKYIRRIEELIGLPVDVLSTGAARHETIILRNPFDVM